MEFEWNSNKALSNERKHRVTFLEAATIFGDPLAITFRDPGHSIHEYRYITFGMSINKMLLVVVHADCKNRVRIISARSMTRKERRIYEEG